MPASRKSKKSKGLPWARLAILALSAVALFAAGEIYQLTRSDAGRLKLARHLRTGDPAQITRIIGGTLREALTTMGVPADSLRESVTEQGSAAVRWRVGVRPDASLLQLNYALSRAVEQAGANVLRGRETWTTLGGSTVTLLVGLPDRPTHEIVLVRAPRPESESQAEPARLALVLYGLGDEPARADSFLALPAPFAVAILAGGKNSRELFRAAHRREREVVMQLPLEPINYPRVNPGPGTLLVTMRPARIASDVRRYLDQAEPLAAVANHMGSLATQDMSVMTAVYRELKRSRVPFLHVQPAAGAVCKSLASDMGIRYEEPDAVIDIEPRQDDAKALERRWKAVLAECRERGALTVMIRATPLTLRWLPRQLESKKLGAVRVVPLSSLVRKPTES
jgi:polysaccharide deacetylase 2 family uncharacterized protein YibQ